MCFFKNFEICSPQNSESQAIIDADIDNSNASGTHQERIFDIISESDEPISGEEISKISGIPVNHVYENLKKMLKTGTIQKEFDSVDEINKYTPS